MPFGFYGGWVAQDYPVDIAAKGELGLWSIKSRSLDRSDPSPGRRFRAFYHAIQSSYQNVQLFTEYENWNAVYKAVQGEPRWGTIREWLGSQLVRDNTEKPIYTEIPADGKANYNDPSVTFGLQDLGWQIGHDITLACDAFNSPDLYYPGVDEGITPVTDDHVRLAIWGMQRELNRERRTSKDGYTTLPAVPLDQLPWRIQRAVAERRRLRYLQWGITKERWLDNRFSIWDISEDADWVPPWTQ